MAISDKTAKTASTAAGAAGFGVGGAIGAGAAIAGVQGAIGLTNSLAGHFLGRHSAKKDAQRQLAMQRDYDAWYLDNIYKEQAEFDYEMAGRYAQNSALWDVIGLKNAGLNPILAAGGGFSGGSNYAAPSGPNGANSVANRSDVDISDPEVAGALSAAANIGSTVANTRTTEAMRAPLVGTAKADQKLKEANSVVSAATARKIEAESRLVDAQTAKTYVDAINSRENAGNPNRGGILNRLTNFASDNKPSDALENYLRATLGVSVPDAPSGTPYSARSYGFNRIFEDFRRTRDSVSPSRFYQKWNSPDLRKLSPLDRVKALYR